jgi:tRNA wybutosine-synthesizing protein 5
MSLAAESASLKRDAVRSGYVTAESSELAWPMSRALVRKPVRSTALRRRLAWLRMTSVWNAVLACVQRLGASVQIVALGAGFDWALLGLLQRRSDSVRCVFEVDKVDVVASKQSMLQQPELVHCCDAQRFRLLACDLDGGADALVALLAAQGFRSEWPTLVLADGVFQYLERASVASLRAWAASLARVCLLEFAPIMCSDDAVAKAMHESMRSRLVPIRFDNELAEAGAAFEQRDCATLESLWNAVSADERRRVLAIEQFDDHEDWHALTRRFAVSLGTRGVERVELVACERARQPPGAAEQREWLVESSSNTRKQIERLGATLCVAGRSLIVFGGFGGGGGQHSLLASLSTTTYAPTREQWTWRALSARGLAPAPRMFHAAALIGMPARQLMLVSGGRADAAGAAFAELFALDLATFSWISLSGVAVLARYRHTLTATSGCSAVALGGRSARDGAIGFDAVEVLRLSDEDGVLRCVVDSQPTSGDAPCARFSHAAVHLPSLNAVAVLGGLDADERAVPCSVLHLLDLASGAWRAVELRGAPPPPSLFGHTMHATSSTIWVVSHELRSIDIAAWRWSSARIKVDPRLLLQQHTSALMDERELAVVGGGACESFNGCARVLLSPTDSFAAATAGGATSPAPTPLAQVADGVRAIRVVRDVSADEFEAIVARKEPVVFANADFGRACDLWTPQHLKRHGGAVDVSAHVCATPFLDFQSRNYRFESMSFAALIDRVFDANESDFLYLRSVGANPRKDVADAFSQWPMLCDRGEQFRVPDCMARLLDANLFSSVFRVASASTWVFTHYDVCDNVLFGIRGRKRAVLFAPRDVARLYVDGSTSRIVDIDSAATSPEFPRFAKAYQRRFETVLEPGQVLFIPALWFHTTRALDAPAIGINLFWRDPTVPREFLSPRDLYGNADPTPAANLLQALVPATGKAPAPSLDALLRALDALPAHYRQFYARKFASELKDRLCLR